MAGAFSLFNEDRSLLLPREFDAWPEPSSAHAAATASVVPISRYLPHSLYCQPPLFPPGSIILTRSLFSPTGKSIAAYQSFLFDKPCQSEWSHVAIVDSTGAVWDANPGVNIQRRTVAEFLDSADKFHCRKLIGDVDLSELDAVIEEQSKARYPQLQRPEIISYFHKFYLQEMNRKNERGQITFVPPFKEDELICSAFVDRVLREAFNIEPLPDSRPPLALPGHFAQSSAFECVALQGALFRLEGKV